MKSALLLAITLFVGASSFAGQARDTVAIMRTRYNTAKNNAKPQGELKQKLDAIDQQLARAMRLGSRTIPIHGRRGETPWRGASIRRSAWGHSRRGSRSKPSGHVRLLRQTQEGNGSSRITPRARGLCTSLASRSSATSWRTAPSPLLARRGGRDIKRNIAKLPLMERTGWWSKIKRKCF